jgi:tetratricopeptide (TPR) repeat protein
LGSVYNDINEKYLAKNAFEKAISIKNDFTTAYIYLGTILFFEDNFIESEKLFDKAYLLEPKNSEINYFLGMIAAKNGFHGKAIEYFQSAIESNELNEDSYLQMAKSFMELDDNEMALETLYRSLRINSTNFEIIYLVGFVYFLQAIYDKAIKYFDTTLKMKPNHRDSYYYKAISLIRQDKYKQALKCFKLILNIYPDDHFALYQQSLIYLHRQETKKAIVILKKARDFGNEEAEEMLKTLVNDHDKEN